MPTKCPKCKREVGDTLEICECGFNLRAHRAEEECKMLEGALRGWKSLVREIARLMPTNPNDLL